MNCQHGLFFGLHVTTILFAIRSKIFRRKHFLSKEMSRAGSDIAKPHGRMCYCVLGNNFKKVCLLRNNTGERKVSCQQ